MNKDKELPWFNMVPYGFWKYISGFLINPYGLWLNPLFFNLNAGFKWTPKVSLQTLKNFLRNPGEGWKSNL